MLCPQCGSQRPDTDNFCAICGSTLHEVVGYSKPAPDLEWEYKDLTIPLNVQAKGAGVTDSMLHAAPQCDEIILRALQQASEEGWQPDGLCDFLSLQKARRIIWWHDKPFSGAMRITCEAASVRLQRLVPGSVLDRLPRVVDQVNH
jgi:hypothetical protein